MLSYNKKNSTAITYIQYVINVLFKMTTSFVFNDVYEHTFTQWQKLNRPSNYIKYLPMLCLEDLEFPMKVQHIHNLNKTK